MSEGNLVTIEGSLRTNGGKGVCRKLRRAGKLPAVLNGAGKSQALEIDPKLLSKAWKEGDRKFNLAMGGQTRVVRITDLQVHPVKRTAIHVDLAYV